MATYILEKTFLTPDGTRLFYRHSDLSRKRRIIVLHGLTEHSGCYVPLMERIFPKSDVSWVALDLRGHGHSEGGKIELETDAYVQGIRELIRHLGWEEGSFLGLAHSFGGLLALHLTLKRAGFFAGLILSAPFLGLPDLSSQFEAVVFYVLSRLFPARHFYDFIIYRRLTHDEELIRQYQNDTLITRRYSLEALNKIKRMQVEVNELRRVEIPVLVLMGEKEKIVSRKAVRRWVSNCRGPIEHCYFPGLYHEVLKEKDNEAVIFEIQNFLRKYGL